LRQQVQLQRDALGDSQHERDENRRPILVWTPTGSRSDWFNGRRLMTFDLVLKNLGQMAFIERIKVISKPSAFESQAPDEQIVRQQVGPSEGVPYPLGIWVTEGDDTVQTIKLTGYARALA